MSKFHLGLCLYLCIGVFVFVCDTDDTCDTDVVKRFDGEKEEEERLNFN